MSEFKGVLADDYGHNPNTWPALWVANDCYSSGWSLNGSTYKPELLSGPANCKCDKCGAEWGLAINSDKTRNEIEKAMKAFKRFPEVQKEMREIVSLLRGQSND